FIDPNVIIANSKWTARVIHDKYKIATAVLYPPVNLSGDYISFAQRRDEFVCIGRISPEKRIERIIEIVKEIRRRGHRMNLRIVGALDGSGYAAKIESLARQSPEWVILEGLRQGKEKVNCLRASRYGIHACEGEAFGIAVAELIKAGCITFAPATGGQSEILNHSALLYHDLGDAADKMTAVLEHEALRGELIRHLRHQAEKFSPESFMAGLREAVNDFNQRSQSLPASLAAT
ncbi:MAG TPA: glycosyltransferase family 4 protein, partial [Candidatus Binataceae bacterium]|nr:glycosyltransferase family 4 protein [Candidatus Binataceae bacterium]